jgi:hypothetical protein
MSQPSGVMTNPLLDLGHSSANVIVTNREANVIEDIDSRFPRRTYARAEEFMSLNHLPSQHI